MGSTKEKANDWRQQWLILANKTVRVGTQKYQQLLLATLSQPSEPVTVAFINAHAMNLAARSQEFFETLEQADYLLRDGSGTKIFFELLGLDPGINLNGTDLIPQLIKLFDGKKIAFYGTKDPNLNQGLAHAKAHLAPSSSFCSLDGFHDVNAYLKHAQSNLPQLIVLGMGMPKQEHIANELNKALRFPCLIVCGGAIIDFLSGHIARAPPWMRRAGIEWLYRLIVEPRRLFYRYVIGNPMFLIKARKVAKLKHVPDKPTN